MFKIQTKQRAQYYSRVIELYLTGELSVRRIAKILPVGRATISRWIDNFAAENPETVQRVMSKRLTRKSLGKDVSPSGEETIASLRAELKVLRARLKDAEIKAEFYDEMINIAEREFNIPIRKKTGAKQ